MGTNELSAREWSEREKKKQNKRAKSIPPWLTIYWIIHSNVPQQLSTKHKTNRRHCIQQLRIHAMINGRDLFTRLFCIKRIFKCWFSKLRREKKHPSVHIHIISSWSCSLFLFIGEIIFYSFSVYLECISDVRCRIVIEYQHTKHTMSQVIFCWVLQHSKKQYKPCIRN